MKYLALALIAISLALPAPANASNTSVTAAPATFRVATYNALGASHTDLPTGNETWRVKAKQRTDLAVGIFEHYRLSVIGTQETQGVQRREFRRVAGRVFGLYCPATPHSPFSGQNCIAWRRADWTVAGGSYLTVPYFHGHRVRMPVLTLRRRSDGALVTFDSVHNPTSSPADGNQQPERAAGWRHESVMAQRLAASGRTTILLGDRNQTARGYLSHVPPGYHVAGAKGIDWIDGHRVAFSGYVSTFTGAVRRATDHPVVFTTASVV